MSACHYVTIGARSTKCPEPTRNEVTARVSPGRLLPTDSIQPTPTANLEWRPKQGRVACVSSVGRSGCIRRTAPADSPHVVDCSVAEQYMHEPQVAAGGRPSSAAGVTE